MKFRTSILSGVLALACAPAAFAADTVDLSVTGTIIPASCTPTLSGGSTIDLGQISTANLSAASATSIPEQSVTLSIHCPTATSFAIRAQDNRAGSASNGGANFYGLGSAPGGEKIGYYSLGVRGSTTTVDGGALGQGLTSSDGGTTWSAQGTGDFWGTLPDGSKIFAFSKSAGAVPSAIQDAAVTMRVVPSIAPRNGLPASDDITIDGSVTFEMVYL
ncbi:DUF1120 domain-containing protein [Lysobacter sp. GCM10012299]|uniref:DUF1120 domain-containing protein n=1 Tax=Lysobacter sp. GCM10012299 TaxID=3317333 RepID=UPI00361C5BBC